MEQKSTGSRAQVVGGRLRIIGSSKLGEVREVGISYNPIEDE
jgi:hypothetical protein